MSDFIRPIAGSPAISDDFNEHRARKSVNPGTDYAVAKGTPILAPAAGVVKIADSNPGGAGGRVVVLFFDNGWSGDFLHLNSLNVALDSSVKQGDVIGYTGGSANGSNSGVGAHLHFSLRNIQSVSLSGTGNVDPELHYGGASAGFNQDVLNRQNYLNSRGWHLEPDGRLGPATKKAIAEFQQVLKNNGFYTGVIDGVWGPGTAAGHAKQVAKDNAPAPAAPASTGSIAEVQQRLKERYPLYAGKLVVDNIKGPATTAAIKEFQRRSGLEPDGIPGPATRRALGL